MLFGRGQRHRRILRYLVGPSFILIFLIFEFRAQYKPQKPTLSNVESSPSLEVKSEEEQERLQQFLQAAAYWSVPDGHHKLSSVSTADSKYFLIDFGQFASNPSIVPHPKWKDIWVITAQKETIQIQGSMWFASISCNANFKNGVLRCVDDPTTLPIPTSAGPHCTGALKFFADSAGPHDARVFYGPQTPHVLYGSNSRYTCFGQWMLGLRTLVDSGYERNPRKEFLTPTELQKPSQYLSVEKNWFVFWDRSGQMYAHYELWPSRGFAQLGFDGTVGPNLASEASASDSKCMARYMPQISQELDPINQMPYESLHQATNSLSITLCGRSEAWCAPDNSNTFIMAVFQKKTFKQSHSVYEPYVMLFRQRAPFEVHGITTKPFWIFGRGNAGTGRKPSTLTAEETSWWTQTESFQITSLSWKDQNQKYHGFVDDILFIAFGIEDSKSAGIDVRAGDLIANLDLCRDS